MNRATARIQARQEADMAYNIRRAADKLYLNGHTDEAERMYAQAKQHDSTCDELCCIAAGTKKHLDDAPVRPATVSNVAPTDF